MSEMSGPGDTRSERIITEELTKVGWTELALEREQRGHPITVKLAARLRKEITMTLKGIAKTLHMGSWTYVSNLLGAVNSSQKV